MIRSAAKGALAISIWENELVKKTVWRAHAGSANQRRPVCLVLDNTDSCPGAKIRVNFLMNKLLLDYICETEVTKNQFSGW